MAKKIYPNQVSKPNVTGFGGIGIGYAEVADLPDAEDYEFVVVLVTDGAAGDPVLAFSDGTDWIRTDNGEAVST